MTPEQFAYWLQGFSELNPSLEAPSAEQWKAIQDHLKTVFVKVTPTFPSQRGTQMPTWPGSTPPTLDDYLRKFPTAPLITC